MTSTTTIPIGVHEATPIRASPVACREVVSDDDVIDPPASRPSAGVPSCKLTSSRSPSRVDGHSGLAIPALVSTRRVRAQDEDADHRDPHGKFGDDWPDEGGGEQQEQGHLLMVAATTPMQSSATRRRGRGTVGGPFRPPRSPTSST